MVYGSYSWALRPHRNGHLFIQQHLLTLTMGQADLEMTEKKMGQILI